MYYSGTPFNEYSIIEKINTKERYFYKLSESFEFCRSVYEGVLQNEIDIIIYQEAKWNDKKLIDYHRFKYGNILFYTENQVGENVYKTTSVIEGKITGYQILKYDSLFRVEIEQSFDKNHLLLEYRALFYENDEKRIPKTEKIFFSSWHISEEHY